MIGSRPSMQVIRRVTHVFRCGNRIRKCGSSDAGDCKVERARMGRRTYPASFSLRRPICLRRFLSNLSLGGLHEHCSTNHDWFLLSAPKLKGFRPLNSKVLIYLWVACDCISTAIAIQSSPNIRFEVYYHLYGSKRC